MARKLPGQYARQTKEQNRRTVKAQLRANIKSGKMKMVKGEVPLGGGVGKAVVKTSAKLARAIAKEAAGPKAKGMTPRKVPLYKLDKAKVTTKGGSSTTISRSPAAQRAPLTKTQREKLNEVTVRYDSPKKLKDAAKARKEAPKARRENVPAPSRAPRKPASKVVRRARTTDQLGKSAASKIEKKIAAKQEAKLTARKNRANRPALIAKNKAAVKRYGEQKQAEKARRTAETRFFTDKTPVKQYDSSERLIGSTTKGELRQLDVKTRRAAADPRNSLRGGKQETIDQRQPRGKELSDKEIEILRKVGKRDYSRGEVNPLAQKIVQGEADRRVGVFFKDPKVRAQDAARTKAAIEKTMSDKALSKRAKTLMNKKTFRGKPKK